MWANKNDVHILFFTFVGLISSAQTTAIPDPVFEQALIDKGLDSGPLDGIVTTANINNITDLTVINLGITNLTGIEGFSSLDQLFCYNNQIINLDLSQNTNLEVLWCNNNLLTHLDLSQNTNIIALDCSANQMNTIDVSILNLLVHFACTDNQITSLNLSQNSNLDRLHCENNLLLNLNLSINTNLTQLSCQNNLLTQLDVNTNSILNTLNCEFNQLTALDVSANPNLTLLNGRNNDLCRLNLRNGNNSNLVADFSLNQDLNCVVVDNTAHISNTWTPTTFSNYVTSQNDCSNFVNVDTLNNVLTNTSYSLPLITFGNYYSDSGGSGIALFAGDNITTSQTIYIYNTTACASNESSFYVFVNDQDFFIPNYFTPNNDGSHDFWEVLDTFNTIHDILIFNRYGKLIKSILPNSGGWNGNFNGKPMVANDYWYVITLNTGETLKGHFTLKR